MSKTYDFKALIQAYIDLRCHSQPEPASVFHTYYAGLVEHLELLFNVSLSKTTFDAKDQQHFEDHWRRTPGVNRRSSWLHFDLTITNYLKVANIRTAYAWSQGDWFFDKHVTQAREVIAQGADLLMQGHLQMLYVIFEQVFGPVNAVFTSNDLLTVGFDDSTEPDLDEYLGL